MIPARPFARRIQCRTAPTRSSPGFVVTVPLPLSRVPFAHHAGRGLAPLASIPIGSRPAHYVGSGFRCLGSGGAGASGSVARRTSH